MGTNGNQCNMLNSFIHRVLIPSTAERDRERLDVQFISCICKNRPLYYLLSMYTFPLYFCMVKPNSKLFMDTGKTNNSVPDLFRVVFLAARGRQRSHHWADNTEKATPDRIFPRETLSVRHRGVNYDRILLYDVRFEMSAHHDRRWPRRRRLLGGKMSSVSPHKIRSLFFSAAELSREMTGGACRPGSSLKLLIITFNHSIFVA